jgi:hypothetical protein
MEKEPTRVGYLASSLPYFIITGSSKELLEEQVRLSWSNS